MEKIILKRGRPRIVDDKNKRNKYANMKITSDVDELIRRVKEIKGLSIRQVFEFALKEYVRRDPDLKHLLKK